MFRSIGCVYDFMFLAIGKTKLLSVLRVSLLSFRRYHSTPFPQLLTVNYYTIFLSATYTNQSIIYISFSATKASFYGSRTRAIR
jgi:hypothetical protein